MEEKLWNVSSSPHVRDHSSTQSIMRDVVIALLPATIIGIYNFRLSAVLVILTCCVSCMLAEYIWQRLMKQKVLHQRKQKKLLPSKRSLQMLKKTLIRLQKAKK